MSGNEDNTNNPTENPATETPATSVPAAEAQPTETAAPVPAPEAAAEQLAAPEASRNVKVTFEGAVNETVEVASGTKFKEVLAAANITGNYTYRSGGAAVGVTKIVTDNMVVSAVEKARGA